MPNCASNSVRLAGAKLSGATSFWMSSFQYAAFATPDASFVEYVLRMALPLPARFLLGVAASAARPVQL
jgi:hypothetical protein